MTGDIWHMDPSLVFTGKIYKREWYRDTSGKRVDGYAVRWCDGGRENWPYSSLVPALVPIASDVYVIQENLDVDTVGDDAKGDSDDSIPCPDGREDPEATEFMDQYLDDSDESDGKIVPEDC